MSRLTFNQWTKRLFQRRPRPRKPHKQRRTSRVSTFEHLSERVVFSVTASFAPGAGVLTVLGDSHDNNIVVSRDAAGRILINGGAISVRGGTPTVANTRLVQAFGLAGNDSITLDEANGALPSAHLYGGSGNDTLIGGSAADLLFGEAGNDILLGKGGDDLLFGGAGDDTLTGGVGTDQVFGQSGNDRMIWNPGEGTDLNEGGAGIDTVEVNGGNGSETFSVTPNGTRVRFDRLDPGPFSIDIGTSENLVVNMNGGDDTFTGTNGLATLISLTVDGGTGNDTITGGDGNDRLLGGDGNDVINGGRGSDTMIGGAGDDTFVWNPGDGSDLVEGQGGLDTMQFNGANINEKIDLVANGNRLRLTRDIGNVTMDVAGVETVNVVALGGADNITVGDLTGTDVTAVNVDLANRAGSGTGDGAADVVTVNGTAAADNVQVFGTPGNLTVAGLSASVQITGVEATNDQLVVSGLGGDDQLSAASLAANVVRLTLDGGAGDDTLVGSQGDDLLIGGDGNDIIFGGKGSDTALMGEGDDTFVWNPGDGSDIVEGQGGDDTLQFNGANIDEKFDLSANGNRLRLTRDIGTVTMDVAGVEVVDLATLGGVDTVNVNDLTGTGVKAVGVDLSSPQGVGIGDGAADTVTVSGTAGADDFVISGSGNSATIRGPSAAVVITGTDGTTDSLTVKGLGGDDTIDASALEAGVISLTLDGGDGNDLLTGSQGDDLIIGGKGADVAFMGDGNDTFVWNPGEGSDIVEGQDGQDTLQFNGANIDEKFDLSANGTRLRLARDIGGVVMDVDGVETVNIAALGGADTITVNDLSRTAATQVNIDLANPANSGTGDGAADTIVVNGTGDDDAITVVGDAGATDVGGTLASAVHITGAEADKDRLVVQAHAGDDVVEATGLVATGIQLTADGGDGDDELIGGEGNDTLLGGNGDDILNGGPGQDILDGGAGDNLLFQ